LLVRWIEEVEENNETFFERIKFTSSNHFRELILRVSQRLGFDEDILNTSDIFMMYDICRFEKVK